MNDEEMEPPVRADDEVEGLARNLPEEEQVDPVPIAGDAVPENNNEVLLEGEEGDGEEIEQEIADNVWLGEVVGGGNNGGIVRIVPTQEWIVSSRRVFIEQLKRFCEGDAFAPHGVGRHHVDFAIAWQDIMLLAFCPDLRHEFFETLRAHSDPPIEVVFLRVNSSEDWGENGFPELIPTTEELRTAAIELGVYLGSIPALREVNVALGDVDVTVHRLRNEIFALVTAQCRNMKQVILDFQVVEEFIVDLSIINSLREHPTLEGIVAINCSTPVALDPLWGMVSSLEQLATVCLDSLFDMATLRHVLSLRRFFELPRLRKLSLVNIEFPTVESAGLLCDAIRNTNVEIFQVQDIRMPENWERRFIDAVFDSVTLVNFMFSYTGFMGSSQFILNLNDQLTNQENASRLMVLGFDARFMPLHSTHVIGLFLMDAPNWKIFEFHFALMNDQWSAGVESALCHYVSRTSDLHMLAVLLDHLEVSDDCTTASPKLLEAANSGTDAWEPCSYQGVLTQTGAIK